VPEQRYLDVSTSGMGPRPMVKPFSNLFPHILDMSWF
jgi:hypothetical protein